MKVTDAHWLDEATRDVIAGGSPLPVRRCLVIHFTYGAGAKSSIDYMRSKGLSAHLVIDRDGTIYQTRPFNVQCAHAGRSRWVDPNTGKKYTNLNAHSIGIEIANFGDGIAEHPNWTKLPFVRAKHRNGGPVQSWEAYPQAQLDSVFVSAKAICKRYNLDDVTGHDCIAPERKNDPGPAFPMLELREFCGFTGLPQVHKA